MLKALSSRLGWETVDKLDKEIDQVINNLKRDRYDFTTYADFYRYALTKVLRMTAGISGIVYKDLDKDIVVTVGKHRAGFRQRINDQVSIYYEPPEQKQTLEQIDKLVQYKAIKTLSELTGVLQDVKNICELHHNELESIRAKKESLLKDVLYYRSRYMPDEPCGFIRLGWPQLGQANLEYGHLLQDVFMALFMTAHTLKAFRDCEFIRLGADCLVYVRGRDLKDVSRKLLYLSSKVTDIGNMLLRYRSKAAFKKAVARYLEKITERQDKINYVLDNIEKSPLLSEFYQRHDIKQALNVIPVLIEKFSDNPFEFLGLARLLNEVNPAHEEFAGYSGTGNILNISRDFFPGTPDKLQDRLKQFSFDNEDLAKFGMFYDNVYFIDKNYVQARYRAFLRDLELQGRELYQKWSSLKEYNPEIFSYLYGDVTIDKIPLLDKNNYLYLDRYYSQIYRMQDPKGTTPFFSKGTHELFNAFMTDNPDWQGMLFTAETSPQQEELLWSIAEKYGKKYNLDPGIARIRLDILLYRFKKDGCLFFRTGGDEFRVIAKEVDNKIGVLDCDFNKLSGFSIFRSLLGDIAVSSISRRIQELFLQSGRRTPGQIPEYQPVRDMNLALRNLNRKNLDNGQPNPDYQPLKVPLSFFGDIDKTLTDKKGQKLKYVRIRIPRNKSRRSFIYAITAEDLGDKKYTRNIIFNFVHDLLHNDILTDEQINELALEPYLQHALTSGEITTRWLLGFSGLDMKQLRAQLEQGLDPEIDILDIRRMNVKGLSQDDDTANISFAFVHNLSLSMGYRQFSDGNFLDCLNRAVEYSELAKKYNDLSILGSNLIIYRHKKDNHGNQHWLVLFKDDKGISHRLLLLHEGLQNIEEIEKKRRAGRQNNATVYELDQETIRRLEASGIHEFEGKVVVIE